jgi:hypothetical protein
MIHYGTDSMATQNGSVTSPAIALPPPLALARSTDTLTPVGVLDARFEMKWDGYRAAAAGGRLWSQRGTDLTRLFPDLAPVLAARLPASAVIDGGDHRVGRRSRPTGLHRSTSPSDSRVPAGYGGRVPPGSSGVFRPTGRRRPGPAWTAAVGTSRASRRAARRVGAPIALCEQTAEPAAAEEWLRTLGVAGIEGVAIKDASAPYPTREDQRVWHKLKTRHSLDIVAIEVVGPPSAPTSLVLATTPLDAEPHAPGATTPLIELTGNTWARHSSWGTTDTVEVQQIRPLVVEVSADAAIEAGVLGHGARLLRARPDLQPRDVFAE